jgi:hypothetical protein
MCKTDIANVFISTEQERLLLKMMRLHTDPLTWRIIIDWKFGSSGWCVLLHMIADDFYGDPEYTWDHYIPS